jgi:hypothetical protein
MYYLSSYLPEYTASFDLCSHNGYASAACQQRSKNHKLKVKTRRIRVGGNIDTVHTHQPTVSSNSSYKANQKDYRFAVTYRPVYKLS